MTHPIRLAIVVGTRPEAVKMAPVILGALSRPKTFDVRVVSTSQHREMLEQTFAAFRIRADEDLDLMQPNQSLTDFASRALAALGACFDRLNPQTVLVQGDTTTVVAASLAAFHRKITVGHVEAGLRSFDSLNPFPEETNRRLTAVLTTLHFAPTRIARQNLLQENIPEQSIFVTGNTVVDALNMINLDDRFASSHLQSISLAGKRVILVTAHRRENHGTPLRQICSALRTLTHQFDDVHVVFPVHLHPTVQGIVREELAGIERISLVNPLGYPDLLRLMKIAFLIMTDSGGIQEEAPSFRKPVLILRKTTERPEIVQAGGARLVGSEIDDIISAASHLLSNPPAYASMCLTHNPFGDGQAAAIILNTVEFHHAEMRNQL